MSTKGLMAHKKVAEVTLHPEDAGKLAGKAKTLTLKEPWLFDGKRGPFELTNVEHGHDIVRGAYDERHGPAATSTRREGPPPRPSTPGATRGPAGGVEPDYGELPAKPPEPRSRFTGRLNSMYVWRWESVSETAKPNMLNLGLNPSRGHVIGGWFMTSKGAKMKDLVENAAKKARPYMVKGEEASYKTTVLRFTQQMEIEARRNKTEGSPWASEHIILGDGK